MNPVLSTGRISETAPDPDDEAEAAGVPDARLIGLGSATLAVMAGINWQITVLSVLLLPIFLFPARYVGRRLARLRREASDLNASMNDQMTERFNAGGATLVKLMGEPEAESAPAEPAQADDGEPEVDEWGEVIVKPKAAPADPFDL